MDAGDQTDKFKIVFMCTGNQARSVIAEHYMRKVTSGLPVEVESVGTLDIPGAPALPEAVDAAAGLSLDLGSHRSRHFSAIDLSGADLVVGFEQNHVATAVVDGNADPQKTFKLLELVRLLGNVPGGNRDADAARAAIAAAASARAQGDPFTPGEDLADPAGRESRFFKETAAAIQRACDEVVRRAFSSAR